MDTFYLPAARLQTPYRHSLSSHLCAHLIPFAVLAVKRLRRLCVLVSQVANMIPKAPEAKFHCLNLELQGGCLGLARIKHAAE